MLPWKLRKRQILPVNQPLSSVYFLLAKFSACELNHLANDIYSKLPKLCSTTLSEVKWLPLMAASFKNEDVFEARVLCFFVVSFKRYCFCLSLNLLMSFFPSKTGLQISVCVCTSNE